jgi:hypothetical protein
MNLKRVQPLSVSFRPEQTRRGGTNTLCEGQWNLCAVGCDL